MRKKTDRPEKNPTEMLLDSLESQFKIKRDTFEVLLPGDQKLIFRHVRTMTDRKNLRTACSAFVEKISKPEQLPSAWKKYLPIDEEIAKSLATIAHLSVEPKFREVDVLRLHTLIGVADLISMQIIANTVHATLADDLEEVEQAKKD